MPIIIIEDDIKPPHNPIGVVYLDALKGLEVGQSFKYPATHSAIMSNQLNNAKTPTKKFITKKVNDAERRVWRVK